MQAPEGGFAAGLAGGFGYVVGRATGEGFNGDAGAALGERTAHDDRHFVSLPSEFFEGDQSIHDGHLHVEQNQVGMIEGEAAEGRSTVGGGSGDLKRRSELTTERNRLRMTAESSTMRMRVGEWTPWLESRFRPLPGRAWLVFR